MTPMNSLPMSQTSRFLNQKYDAYQYALERVEMLKKEEYEEELLDENDDWWHMESQGSTINVWLLERKVK